MGELDKHLEEVRIEYSKKSLSRADLDTDPIEQFGKWFKEAMAAELPDLNVAHLATIENGHPSVRVVLIRSYNENGFVFFTNYSSAKGKAIAADPNVCLNVFWWPMERQIRIEGVAEKISREENEAYFKSRPRESQIGAIASDQSQKISERESLDARYAELEKAHEGKEIPCPENWGGYLVRPTAIEFWQGREGRLHDRFRFVREGSSWAFDRLQP